MKITFVCGVVTILKCGMAIYDRPTQKSQHSPEYLVQMIHVWCVFHTMFDLISNRILRYVSAVALVTRETDLNRDDKLSKKCRMESQITAIIDKTHSSLKERRQKRVCERSETIHSKCEMKRNSSIRMRASQSSRLSVASTELSYYLLICV